MKSIFEVSHTENESTCVMDVRHLLFVIIHKLKMSAVTCQVHLVGSAVVLLFLLFLSYSSVGRRTTDQTLTH